MKLKNKIILFYPAILIGFFSIFGNMESYAEQSTVSTNSTYGKISFSTNSGPNNPKDPNDPSKDPSNPNENGNPDDNNHQTGNTGDLTITVAPNSFDFGSQKKYAAEHTYSAQGDFDQYLQVDDNRDAGTQGWTLTAKQNRDLTDDSTGKKMTGITFYIPKGTVHNALDTTNKGLTSSAATVDTSNESTVFSSSNEENAGKGTSTDVWKSGDVKLNIPQNTAADGNYSNKINWTLTASAK